MTDETNSRQKWGGAVAAPAVLVRVVQRFSRILQGDLAVLIDRALQHLDDALYDRANRAESDQLYAAYFEALRQLRRERNNLKRAFLRNLSDSFLRFQEAPQRSAVESSAGFDADNLELVKDKDLEESLVLSNIISKADNRYLYALRDLTRHFASLSGRTSLRQQDIPVSPAAICHAFSAAVKALDALELSTALIIYKVFDNQVMDNLGPVYAQCVELAMSQGLEPTAKHQIINNPALMRPPQSAAGRSPVEAGSAHLSGKTVSAAPSDKVSSSDSPAGAATAPAADSTAASVTGPVSFQQLCILLHGGRREAEPPSAIPPLGTEELMTVLSRLQQQFDADETMVPGVLRQSLIGELALSDAQAQPQARDPRRRLERCDEDAMDLVFLLFEQLLSAPDIPDSIKVLISRLQLPYVKVAILEPVFFDQADHPARSLLNHIGEASLGWNDNGERRGDGLYARIATIVERVITEFSTDPRLFQILDSELAAYLDEQQRQARAAELHARRSIGDRRRHDKARRHVMNAIGQRLPAREAIPVVVASIIYDGWVEVMLDSQSREGEHGPGWQHALRVLDQLVWSIRPKQSPAERRELLRQIPQMLRDLRTALSEVVSDQRVLERWLKELQGVYIAALRGPTPYGAPESTPESSREPAPPATTENRERRADRIPPASIDPDALPIGTWLEIMRTDDNRLRVKLAWRSEDGHDLLFVDRLGRKAFELSRRDLDTLFEQDLAEVIGDGSIPIVDRAMHAVRESLSVH